MFVNLLADFNLGTIADITIAVLAFILIIANMKKGFVKQVIGLVATIAALVMAYLFCSKVTEFVNDKFGWHDKLAASLLDGFAKNGDTFNVAANAETIKAAVQSLGLPDFVSDVIVKIAANASGTYASVGQLVADVLAKYILLAASFIVLFIVIRIILQLVKALIVKLFNLPILKGVDRLLAFALGVVKTLIIIYVAVYLIQIMPNVVPFVDSLKTAVNESQIITFINATGVVETCLKMFSDLLSSLKI